MKPQKKFNIIKLDGGKLLETKHCWSVDKNASGNNMLQVYIRLSKLEGMQIISAVEPEPESALFFQICDVIKKNDVQFDENDPDCLKSHIICVDFKDVFLTQNEKNLMPPAGSNQDYQNQNPETLKSSSGWYFKLQWLFDPAARFTIEFTDLKNASGEKLKVDFAAFDKSSSMARNSRIYFIERDLKDAVDERIRLGIDFSKFQLSPSKYYAYRGLYCTASRRIEHEDLILNEETVVVIKDREVSGDKNTHRVVTAEKSKDQENFYDVKEAEVSISTTWFDGEGLICPEYAACINTVLFPELKLDPADQSLLKALGKICDDVPIDAFPYNLATSMQIRMPFVKGMLHTVDFHHFFRRHGIDEKQTRIIDCFGQKRALSKVKIILTESMFKAKKWLGKWQVFSERAENRRESFDDPMAYYFEKFRAYHHSLYIGNTSCSATGKKYTKVNYQFLNPLAMDLNNFSGLAASHYEAIDKLASDPETCRAYLRDTYGLPDESAAKKFAGDPIAEMLLLESDTDTADYEDMSGEILTDAKVPAWVVAVLKNKAFLSRDNWIKNIINSIQNSLAADGFYGQFRVPGECRYLSHDLLPLLVYSVQCTDLEDNQKKNIEQQYKHIIKKDGVSEVKQYKYIRNGKFYLPSPNMTIEKHSSYVFLRNPHLSRNEECALQHLPDNEDKKGIYDLYFGHLKGIVMIPTNSFVAETLGGADFDGDLVKIIGVPSVTKAVLNTCYTENTDKKKEPVYKRNLPFVSIPGSKPTEKFVTNCADYEVLHDTFTNAIGKISNLAILLGRYAYADDFKISWGQQSKKYSDLRTIIDGLSGEIKEELRLSCPGCTIITGLEIDAAKNGNHPKANIAALDLFIERLAKKYAKDPYLQTKDDFEEIRNIQHGWQHQTIKLKGYPVKYTKKKDQKKKTIDTLKDISESNISSRLDLLPYHYLNWRYAQEKAEPETDAQTQHKTEPQAVTALFDFQNEPEWQNPDNMRKTEIRKVKILINVYDAVKKFERKYKSVQRSIASNAEDYLGRIYTILWTQYDDPNEKMGHFSLIEEELNRFFSQKKDRQLSIQEAVHAMVEHGWQYQTTDDEKKETLMKILNPDASDTWFKDTDFSCLYNFSQRGYLLLYYLLAELYCQPDQLRFDDILFNDTKNHPCYQAWLKMMAQSIEAKESPSIWHDRLKKACLTEITKAFGSMEAALPYIFYAGEDVKSTQYREFFWTVMPPHLLIERICEEKNNAE